MNPFLEIKNVSYSYMKNTAQQVNAVNNVSLGIDKGEMVGIIGHTGSGKSTLVSLFNGLLKPSLGTVYVNGKDIWENKETLRESRFKVGLCFQYPEYQLFEETVRKDIAFGPKNMKLDDAEIERRVLRAAELAGVKPKHLDVSPFDISGGEKRRAAIAGVMAMEPDMLVLDEPAAGLDPRGRSDLIEMIKQYRERTGSAVVLVSHSMEDIARATERVIVINNGEIALDGSVDYVFAHEEELKSMGLNIPEVTKVFHRLKELGFDVPPDVYSVDRAVDILTSLAERRKSDGK